MDKLNKIKAAFKGKLRKMETFVKYVQEIPPSYTEEELR